MVKRNTRRTVADASNRPCPCGSTKTYGDCCGRMHRGEMTAATAEELMRSRFSAFAVDDAEYLLRTWHTSTRPDKLELDLQHRWVRLDILSTSRGGLFDTVGTVEFRAHYRESGRLNTLYENSHLVREDGQWVYLDTAESALRQPHTAAER